MSDLRQLPGIAHATCQQLVEYIQSSQEINAAIVNISGRQRMLCQRTTLFALQLVTSPAGAQRLRLRQELQAAINLMEVSHNGLIYGSPSLKLPGNPSPRVAAMYFEPPLHLDRQIHTYITEARSLLLAEEDDLTLTNPHLGYLLQAADHDLLDGLDAIVRQYQRESEAEQAAISQQLICLYEQSRQTAAIAQQQAEDLEHTLKELHRTQTQLIHTEKMSSLGQLVAGVAHEINNPMNFISGNLIYAEKYLQGLLELVRLYQTEYPEPTESVRSFQDQLDLEFIAQDAVKVLASMKLGSERIRQIVLTLRNFSRLDEAEIKAVDLHEGIESSLVMLQSRLKAVGNRRDIRVIKHYGDLPAVECFAGQLNQVFMNLLANAIDALGAACPEHHEQPTINISTELLSNGWVRIAITDNGCGMTPEVQSRLFDPFFTTKPVGQGTGLGLAISYQIVVKKHAGNLTYHSERCQGTTFWIEIPGCYTAQPLPGSTLPSREIGPLLPTSRIG